MSDGTPRMELYLRSLAPSTAREHQDQVVERLDTLDETDAIRRYEIVLCGDCVCPDAATADTQLARRLLDAYETFREWADDQGRDLVGFERRDRDGLLTGSSITGIAFPRMVLAEYEDNQLQYVAPSSDGEEQTTVSDRLETYAPESRS